MKQKILISKVGRTQSRPDDHFPNGARIFIDIECETSAESLRLIDLFRKDQVWVSNEEPIE